MSFEAVVNVVSEETLGESKKENNDRFNRWIEPCTKLSTPDGDGWCGSKPSNMFFNGWSSSNTKSSSVCK